MKNGLAAALDSTRARAWAGAGAIALAGAAAYAGSFSGAFQFDDIPAILDNPTVRRLWPPGVPFSPPGGALTVSGRPVLNFSLALNYAASGYGAWSYHALNLAIHLAAALILFGIVRRTLERTGHPRPLGSALAVALLWVVHPLTTEAVTYVVQRAESLMGMFYLATLYCFIRGAGAGGGGPGRGSPPPWLGLSWLACLLGVGTKEVMVSAPLAVLLYDRTFLAGSWAGAWRARRGYYLAMAGTWVPLLWLVGTTGWDRGATSGFHVGVPWLPYWVSQGEAAARYVSLSLWPHPLAFDYGPPSAAPGPALILFALLLLASAATVAGCVRGRRWAFPAGVALLVLAPTGVMPGVLQFAAEHRMYLPLAAIATGVVLGVEAAADRWVAPAARRTAALAALLALAAGALAAATAARNADYRTELGLWLDTIAKRPRSAVAQANVGKALLERHRLAEALPHCAEAVRLDPAKPAAHYNLGMAFEEQERWADALGEFAAAAAINPKLYLAQFRAGRILDRLGRWADAERFLRLALSNEPDLPEAHGGLGVALAGEGRQGEAVEEFERALRLQPDQPDVEFDLGLALAGQGRLEEAVRHYAAAARLQPDHGQAQQNLGVGLAQLGRPAEALPALQAAVRLLPDSAEAHSNLGTALDQLVRTDEAIAEFRSALRLRPDYAAAHYNLGNALLRARDPVGARDEFSAALRLDPGFEAAREMLDRIAAPSEGK